MTGAGLSAVVSASNTKRPAAPGGTRQLKSARRRPATAGGAQAPKPDSPVRRNDQDLKMMTDDLRHHLRVKLPSESRAREAR